MSVGPLLKVSNPTILPIVSLGTHSSQDSSNTIFSFIGVLHDLKLTLLYVNLQNRN